MGRHLVMAVVVLAAASANPQRAPARQDPDGVRSAIDFVRRNEAATLSDQVRLCEIAAPTFNEAARAEAVAVLLRGVGLKNVYLDTAGNVVAERPGRLARPHLVLAAHLDAVSATSAAVTQEGTLWRGVGISDNCRGLAVLVAVARTLEGTGMQTEGPVTFAATVGEEGLGDLRGVRELVGRTLKGRVDRFVALDGAGYAITTAGVGSRRFRVIFNGPGGHSYQDFGRASAVQALGRAIALAADTNLPPGTTFNVGRVGGGEGVNTIADHAWMEIDLRSVDGSSLDAVEMRIRAAIDRAVEQEEAKAHGVRSLTSAWQRIGERPAARMDASAPIVKAAQSISRTLGVPSTLVEGSTDANFPMSLGIPSIAIGAGGTGGGIHSPAEWFNASDSVKGTERALLLALALSRSGL